MLGIQWHRLKFRHWTVLVLDSLVGIVGFVLIFVVTRLLPWYLAFTVGLLFGIGIGILLVPSFFYLWEDYEREDCVQ